MLRRFADARLRRRIDRLIAARDGARQQIRALKAELAQAKAAEQTNYDLAQRWKSIAHGQAAFVAELRQQQKETTHG